MEQWLQKKEDEMTYTQACVILRKLGLPAMVPATDAATIGQRVLSMLESNWHEVNRAFDRLSVKELGLLGEAHGLMRAETATE